MSSAQRPRASDLAHLALLACGLACLALLPAGRAFAQDGGTHATSLEDLFRTGNEMFFQNDLVKARASYERLVEAGVDDPDVYFNLGLAHARLGELGRAISSFERALRLAPGDSDAATALSTARAALGKRRAERQGEATVETRPPLSDALVEPFRQNTLAVWLLVLDVLFFALLLLRRVARDETLRTAFAVAAATSLLGVFAAGGGLWVKRGGLDEGRAAIVLREGAELREGPDPRARARASAHEGARARVLRRDGAFLRARIEGGPDGWMQEKDIAVVEP